MRPIKTLALAIALTCSWQPTLAFAAEDSGQVPVIVSGGVGSLALLFAIGLLLVMLSLRKLAEGSAIADNITFAVLATLCLAASVLTGWIGLFIAEGLSIEYARLGADALALVAIVLFGVYFYRVRSAMARFLGSIVTNDESLIASMNEQAEEEQSRG